MHNKQCVRWFNLSHMKHPSESSWGDETKWAATNYRMKKVAVKNTHTHTQIIIIVIIMSRHAASYCVNNISSLIFPAQTDSTCASLHYIETLESSLSTEQRWKPPDCCKDINRAKWVINHLIKHDNRGVPLTWQHFSLVPYLSMFLAYELKGKFPPKWIVIYSPPMPMKSDDEVL